MLCCQSTPPPPLPPPHVKLLGRCPYLIILHTLHGELVAVNPQGVAEDGDAVALLELEDLKSKRRCEVASW